MKTLIQKLIDGLLIQPLTNAITNRLRGGFTSLMEDLSEVKQAVVELKQAVLDEHTRIDGLLDTYAKKLEQKADEHGDPELTTMAEDIRNVTSGLSAFHPADAPPPASGSGQTTPPTGGETP